VRRLSSHSGGVVAPDCELLDVVDGAVGLWRGGEQARGRCAGGGMEVEVRGGWVTLIAS
jgi:hypothetical protein